MNVMDKADKTALMMACMENGSVDIVKLLLRHENCPNDYINHKDKDDKTALLYANNYDNEEIVKELLLQPGIDVDKHGKSTLHHAMAYNWVEVVKIILTNKNLNLATLMEEDDNPRLELLKRTILSVSTCLSMIKDALQVS